MVGRHDVSFKAFKGSFRVLSGFRVSGVVILSGFQDGCRSLLGGSRYLLEASV